MTLKKAESELEIIYTQAVAKHKTHSQIQDEFDEWFKQNPIYLIDWGIEVIGAKPLIKYGKLKIQYRTTWLNGSHNYHNWENLNPLGIFKDFDLYFSCTKENFFIENKTSKNWFNLYSSEENEAFSEALYRSRQLGFVWWDY